MVSQLPDVFLHDIGVWAIWIYSDRMQCECVCVCEADRQSAQSLFLVLSDPFASHWDVLSLTVIPPAQKRNREVEELRRTEMHVYILNILNVDHIIMLWQKKIKSHIQ